MLDTFTDISGALSKLVTSFNALMKKFEPSVKIVDEVAKVRFFGNLLHWTIHIDQFSEIHPSIHMSISCGKSFHRNESELIRLFWSFSSYASIRSAGASTTSSECEDSRSLQSDGGYLLVKSHPFFKISWKKY